MDYTYHIPVKVWIEIGYAFFDAYVRFCTEGTESHRFIINNRNIEITFFDRDGVPYIKQYCTEVMRTLITDFNRSVSNTEEIIDNIHWLAFVADDAYSISTVDSEKAHKQIKEILEEKIQQCIVNYHETLLEPGSETECVIELNNRKILVSSRCCGYSEPDERIGVWLNCTTTGRSLFGSYSYEETDLEDIIQKIQYLALEPECSKIVATDSEQEYEMIRTIVVDAIDIASHIKQKRIIELHDRQIEIQFTARKRETTNFKERSYYINASLTCITTGKSCSCDVEAFDKNPEELIWKIQKLAWENVET